MILVFIIAGSVILMAGGFSVRLGSRVHPSHRVTLTLGVLITGLFLAEAGLLLWSSPVILDMLGFTELAVVCRRMLGGEVPGGVAGGVAAGLAALWLGGAACKGGWDVMRAQRRLRVESVLPPCETREEFDLFVLPSSRRMAYTVGGRRPQVVLTSAVVEDFSPELVGVITAHEGVHARHHHHRALAMAAAIGAAVGWFQLVARAVDTVRLSLERWADEDASLMVPHGREDVKQALLAVCMSRGMPGVAGFGTPEMVSARIAALDEPAPARFSAPLASAYVAFGAGAVIVAASVGWATTMAVFAVIKPGQCLV